MSWPVLKEQLLCAPKAASAHRCVLVPVIGAPYAFKVSAHHLYPSRLRFCCRLLCNGYVSYNNKSKTHSSHPRATAFWCAEPFEKSINDALFKLIVC